MSRDIAVSVYNETTLLVEDLTVKERYANDIKDEVFSEVIWLPGSFINIRFGSTLAFKTVRTSFFIERSDSKHSSEDYQFILSATAKKKDHHFTGVKYLNATKTRVGCDNIATHENMSRCFLHETDILKFLIVFKNDTKFHKYACLHREELHASEANRSDYYDEGVGLDFTIMIKDKSIKASKYVLGMYSPVFKSMFRNDWKDSLENIVSIEDVEYEIMLMLVKALHNVRVILDEVRTSLQLLIVADKYCVEYIKRQIINYISKVINASNVIDVLTTAHQFNIEDMKQDALNFLTSKKSENLEEIDGYNQMPAEIALIVLNETRKKLFTFISNK